MKTIFWKKSFKEKYCKHRRQPELPRRRPAGASRSCRAARRAAVPLEPAGAAAPHAAPPSRWSQPELPHRTPRRRPAGASRSRRSRALPLPHAATPEPPR
ncbi:unnamed protein product [Urochloa humidicola]